MRKKPQVTKMRANSGLSTKADQESAMTTSEIPENDNTFLEKVKSPLTCQSTSNKKVINRFFVRRSERIQNSTLQNRKTPSVIEEITLSESDDEEDELPNDSAKSLPPNDQDNDWQELLTKETKFEAKIDYMVQILEFHGYTLDSIKTEIIKRSSSTETVPSPEMNYKSMYIASQIKIEELAEENRVLTKKLENALDRFETFKNGNHDAFEMLEKMKDVIGISNGLRVSASTQAMYQAELNKVTSLDAGDASPPSKKKTLAKKKKRIRIWGFPPEM